MKEELVLTDQEKALIRGLQGDIALDPAPFRKIGESVGFSEAQVLEKICSWKAKGVIRRFGAALKHHKAGIAANAMVVWKVPIERTRDVGKIMASFSEVSHCYERPVFPEWPYNMYTMVHGASISQCEQIASSISKKTGIKDFQMLFSTKEYKKSSMKYFAESR